MSWEPTQIRVRPGDTITSKGGLLFSSNLTGKEEFYTTKRVKYLGDGVWEARGESKQPIEVDPVQQGGPHGACTYREAGHPSQRPLMPQVRGAAMHRGRRHRLPRVREEVGNGIGRTEGVSE